MNRDSLKIRSKEEKYVDQINDESWTLLAFLNVGNEERC